jgi:ATP-dependent helicase/nuclease subunit B
VTLRIEACPYGEPAFLALRGMIDAIKVDDPFALVTVVVSRGPVGLGVRRALAQEVSAEGRQGVSNVAFVTAAGLAATLAGTSLGEEGRAPLTDAVLRASVRTVLSEKPTTMLGRAGDHPSTVDALVATYRELRPVDSATLDAVAGLSRRAAELVDVLRDVRQHTANWFDDMDVLEAATSRVVSLGRAVAELTGPVVLYLPGTLNAPTARFFATLADQVPCTAIIGVTGDQEADSLGRELAVSLGADQDVAWPDAVEILSGDGVLSAPTVDAELLLVVRDLMARCAAGTPLERMAIVHSGSTQYVTLLHTMLRQAGIPYNGGGVRPLSATVAGRILLGALALTDHDWRRGEVAEWLNTGPIVHHGRSIPATRWDVLSAEAGVSEGLLDWKRQLEQRAAELRNDAERGDGQEDVSEAWRRVRRSDAEQCDALLAFLHEMAARVAEAPSTWGEWSEWVKGFLHRLVGGPTAMAEWPGEEPAAAEAVERAIESLAVLAQLETSFTPALARTALISELTVPAPQTSRFGTGVWVAPLGAVVGLSLDVLYVVGLNDGTFPGRPTDDVLLPDHERRDVAAGGAIPLRGVRPITMRRDFLAALAGARTRLLSYPRGNQRDGRELRPSRWALDTIGAVTGSDERLYSGDLESVRPNGAYRVEPSYMSTVAAPGLAFSLDDRDLRSLLVWRDSGHGVADHFLSQEDRQLRRGIEFIEGRRAGFTRFNGNLGLGGAQADLVPPLFSATRLEGFAKCPRRYFFERVLEVLPRPVSERLVVTDRMEYGSLVHRILERFVRSQVGRRPGEGPDDPFEGERLMAVAEEEMRAFEAAGLAGPLASWRVEQTRLRRELRRFATEDMAWRRRQGIVTTGVEQVFGRDGVDPVAVSVPRGEPVYFRGSIDRVDEKPDGSLIISDYKTGSPAGFKTIGEDHFQHGSAIQLPVYARAVGAAVGHPVESAYWCVSERGEFTRYGFVVDGDALEELGAVVGALTTTMANGQFPGNAGSPGEASPCTYCDYDAVCPPDRHHSWDQVKRDPALAGYHDLVAPE